MMIPKSFKVGHLRYRVQLHMTIPNRDFGHIFYDHGLVRLATHIKGVPRHPAALSETFWHETTHAILHDMRHALAGNEAFVTDFSQRLNQVVHTARL